MSSTAATRSAATVGVWTAEEARGWFATGANSRIYIVRLGQTLELLAVFLTRPKLSAAKTATRSTSQAVEYIVSRSMI